MDKKKGEAYFDLAIYDTKKIERKELVRSGETHKSKEKLQMFEYLLEHLDISSLVAVHLTDYFPQEGIIKPISHFLLDLYSKNKIAQKLIKGKDLRHCRSTIHFSLNCAVEGVVGGGEWHRWSTKYAILIPLKDAISRFASLDPVDSWIIGMFSLPKSAEILVPENEYSKYKSKGGPATVISYDPQKKIQDVANLRIAIKGFHNISSAGGRQWYEGMNIQRVAEFIKASEILTEDEKIRLIRLANKKGFNYWTQVIGALKKKYAKEEFHTHDQSFWREMEKEMEEKFFGPLFGAQDYELSERAELNFFDRGLGSFWEKAQYGTNSLQKPLLEYKKKHYSLHSDELATLDELEKSLKRLDKWMKELFTQVEIILKNEKEITWEEVYKKIGLK
jgi:hypothetical protein